MNVTTTLFAFFGGENPAGLYQRLLRNLLAQITDAYLGSSSAGLWSTVCIDFCSEFQGVLISFRLAGLLSDS